ncbi:MAG: methionyl-tRNA formyltransferase [Treponema sp.]
MEKTKNMLNVLFAGTPSFVIPSINLIAIKFNLVGVLTAPSTRRGRKMEVQNSDVFNAYEELKNTDKLAQNIPIFTPKKLDDELMSAIKELQPDLLVCFAYGKIFTKQFMSLFKKGGINIHPSLLPKWRGPAPIPFAMWNGEFETGISIQTIKEALDSGDILLQEKFKIEKDEIATEVLENKVSKQAVVMLEKVLDNFDEYLVNAKLQNEKEATYSRLLNKTDGLIDWSNSAEKIERQIHAFATWPGTYTFCNGKKLNIINAHVHNEKDNLKYEAGKILGKNEGILVATGDGVLVIDELQWETKKKLKWKDFLNGSPNFLSSTLGNMSYFMEMDDGSKQKN